jgi:predicted RNA-binding protein YlxR (DUF448 family)
MHDEQAAPVRTCVGCRRRAPSHDLVRVRRGADRQLEVGAGDGRGAWLCRPPGGLACFDAAAKRGAFARALRAGVSAEALALVRARLVGHHDAGARRDGPVDDETQDGTSR